MKRRDFIRYGTITSSGVMLMSSLPGCVDPLLKRSGSPSSVKSLEELYEGFRNPPVESKLFVRWWWNGNRLSGKEILRELDVMKAAGIGGVEINPIAFPGGDPAGYEAMTMFSDDWLEMLRIALQGAKERGMVCDMIVGSGWPFGGEFLEKDHQTQMVTIGTLDLAGGREYHFNLRELLDPVDPPIHSRNKTVYKELIRARLLPKQSGTFTEGTDLTNLISEEDLVFEVPGGPHVLYFVVKLTGFMAVINGAPGAAGPVLNHYSREATETYLNRISGLITGKIGDMGRYIRAMFCDSMELEGANWVDDLPDEFEKRRGYPLWPWLPFILKKTGHMGNPLDEEYGTEFSPEVAEEIKRVGLDFYRTRIELFKERFIDTFNDWCHRNHVQSRMQAYGRGMHPLGASMYVDIPECETWMSHDVGRTHPGFGLSGRAPLMCNKYVASGAALAGRRIVSCEEITNTSMVFMASLENIKIAGDQSNISGVNHSILHGFNYSPPEAGLPGWVRYGTWFNEQNTWWPWFPLWAAYKARISFLLQNAVPEADIAILQPLTDLWLKYGPQRDPFPQKVYPEYQDNLWEAVHQNGGGCDYVSEHIINHSTFGKGRMIFNNRSYSTLLLPEIETLDTETVRSLSRFASRGGKIVFIGKRPFKSPDYIRGKARDERVRKMVDDLVKNPDVVEYQAPAGDVIRWFGTLQEKLGLTPYVKFDPTHPYLGHSCYRLGDYRLFLVANTSLSEHISVKAEFQVDGNLHPWVWDPESGARYRYPTDGDNHRIRLELPRATSALILFGPDEKGDPYRLLPVVAEPGVELSGAWQVQLNHRDGQAGHMKMETLHDLAEKEATRHFAGEIVYSRTLDLDPDVHRFIDLGDVRGVSELALNGVHLGTRWYGAHSYDISGAVKKGENQLTIKVTTLIGNYLKSLSDNPVAMGWTRHQRYYPMGMMGPVRIL